MSHAALEQRILKENAIQDNNPDAGKYQIIDINQINLTKYLYAKPKLSMLIEHSINAKAQLIFEPPFE